MTKYYNKQGFVLIYAVIVVSVVLVTSLLLSDIITRQIIITSINKNYQQAYYIANIAKECAQYLDSQFDFGVCGEQAGSGGTIRSCSPRAQVGEELLSNSCYLPDEFSIIAPDPSSGQPLYEGDGQSIEAHFFVKDENHKNCAKVDFFWPATGGKSIRAYGFNTDCFTLSSKRVMAMTQVLIPE